MARRSSTSRSRSTDLRRGGVTLSPMKLDRRQLLTAMSATLAWRATALAQTPGRPLRRSDGDVDWDAVRALFPLAPDKIHLASFLFVSHPAPVAAAIETFRRKIDADPTWLEEAAFAESEGKPFSAAKRALAGYVGGAPEELCFTSNTTQGLAMAYHGLRIRANQEILTTEHDHYVHHESIRYAAARSGATVRYVGLYDQPARAGADEMVARLSRAITAKTRAIGVTWVHSSTGVKVPIAPIAAAVARANRGRADADRCLLIVDGVHGFGNQDVDVATLGADFFATSTHKWMLAPRGTGFLWGRKEVWPALRPTIPSFDPEQTATWEAWMERKPLSPTQASFISPGGFLAYEHLLAIPAAIELHRTLGRDRIAARIQSLNARFRDEVAKIAGVTLHTPRDPAISAGISCFEIKGLTAEETTTRLAAKRVRTSSSPYKVAYARVSAGIANRPEDIEVALREISALARS